MKRRTRQWGRILFNTLTAISLLLAIATAGLWVRSASRYDGIRYDGSFGQVGVASSDSGLRLAYVESRVNATTPQWSADSRESSPSPPRGSWWQRRGFTFLNPSPGGRTAILIGVPHWLPMTVFGVAPAMWAWQRLRAISKPTAQICPVCGYDTRANPAKCSECGHEIAAANL